MDITYENDHKGEWQSWKVKVSVIEGSFCFDVMQYGESKEEAFSSLLKNLEEVNKQINKGTKPMTEDKTWPDFEEKKPGSDVTLLSLQCHKQGLPKNR